MFTVTTLYAFLVSSHAAHTTKFSFGGVVFFPPFLFWSFVRVMGAGGACIAFWHVGGVRYNPDTKSHGVIARVNCPQYGFCGAKNETIARKSAF